MHIYIHVHASPPNCMRSVSLQADVDIYGGMGREEEEEREMVPRSRGRRGERRGRARRVSLRGLRRQAAACGAAQYVRVAGLARCSLVGYV